VSVDTTTELYGELSEATVGVVIIGTASSEMMQILPIRVANETGFNLKRLSVQAESLPACREAHACMEKGCSDGAIPTSLPIILD